jgi:hypothetical protein
MKWGESLRQKEQESEERAVEPKPGKCVYSRGTEEKKAERRQQRKEV